jgi:hypothetical protein
MASRTSPPPVPQPAVLDSRQLRLGIERLTKRLAAVQKFEPTSVQERFKSPQLTALRKFVEEGLANTFGPGSADYERTGLRRN